MNLQREVANLSEALQIELDLFLELASELAACRTACQTADVEAIYRHAESQLAICTNLQRARAQCAQAWKALTPALGLSLNQEHFRALLSRLDPEAGRRVAQLWAELDRGLHQIRRLNEEQTVIANGRRRTFDVLANAFSAFSITYPCPAMPVPVAENRMRT